MNPLYDHDFHAWANQQAALLRAGRLNDADIGNIAEEMENMGRSERRELVNRLTVLLLHLLKWRFQPERQGKSWRLSIKRQRFEIEDHLAANPSLKPYLSEAVITAYRLSRLDAADETGLDESVFPSNNPWNVEELLDQKFFPSSNI